MGDLPYISSFEFVLIKARFSLYLLTITKLYLFYCKIFQFYIYFYMCCGQNMHNLTYLSWCHLDSQTLDMPIYDILSSKWELTLFSHLLPLSIYGFIQSFVGHGDWKNEARFQAFKPLLIVFASNLGSVWDRAWESRDAYTRKRLGGHVRDFLSRSSFIRVLRCGRPVNAR